MKYKYLLVKLLMSYQYQYNCYFEGRGGVEDLKHNIVISNFEEMLSDLKEHFSQQLLKELFISYCKQTTTFQ